jgi:uncharacterized Fe-S center protein
MAKVYFKSAGSYAKTDEVSRAGREVLERTITEEKIDLEKRIPLKVHFGEKGNETFIRPENYEGMIDFLEQKGTECSFTETNVLYLGERTVRDSHIALAKEHGFSRLPIIIADGEKGEDYSEVAIDKKHFKSCKIGRLIAEEKQLLVVAHFKGHMLAGFGGAIKQLGMGCASRPGKLAQHSGSQPLLNPLKCTKCKTCVEHCPRDAIELGLVPRVNGKKCIGCAVCIAVCPSDAMGVNWMATKPATFREKLAEYAYAAHKGKRNIYVNFAENITKECDCFGEAFKPIAADIGVFASTDPVALDKACWDMLNKREGKKVFGGEDIFNHAEEIGLGKREYELIIL